MLPQCDGLVQNEGVDGGSAMQRNEGVREAVDEPHCPALPKLLRARCDHDQFILSVILEREVGMPVVPGHHSQIGSPSSHCSNDVETESLLEIHPH